MNWTCLCDTAVCQLNVPTVLQAGNRWHHDWPAPQLDGTLAQRTGGVAPVALDGGHWNSFEVYFIMKLHNRVCPTVKRELMTVFILTTICRCLSAGGVQQSQLHSTLFAGPVCVCTAAAQCRVP